MFISLLSICAFADFESIEMSHFRTPAYESCKKKMSYFRTPAYAPSGWPRYLARFDIWYNLVSRGEPKHFYSEAYIQENKMVKNRKATLIQYDP